jgi:hypothetical protein
VTGATFTIAGRDASWMLQAACRPGSGVDPNWFDLPHRHQHAGLEEDRRWRDEVVRRVFLAKVVCSRCPVIDACEAWARSMPEREGIWGGLTPAERGLRAKKDRRKRGGL